MVAFLARDMGKKSMPVSGLGLRGKRGLQIILGPAHGNSPLTVYCRRNLAFDSFQIDKKKLLFIL